MSRILVVDDDLQQLDIRKQLLEVAGHQVALAMNPVQTMHAVERGAADLVIMDLRFPNAEGNPDSAEGLALIRSIRDAGFLVPVIVLSGWPDDLYGRPEERMVSRIMVKPVQSAHLVEAVAALAR